MAQNSSALDRGIRIALGLGLVSLTFVGPATAWGWVGLIPLLTGAIGFCPLYQLIGIGTKHADKAAS